MDKVLFTVKLELKDGPEYEIRYESLDQCLWDWGLKAVLESGQVASCAVYQGSKRIVAIPFMEWERFKEALIANSTTILRGTT
jgi:hypothetical protein